MSFLGEFLPLFPHADQLELGNDAINKIVTELDRTIHDASYTYELAIEYLAENRFNANNFKSIRSELNLLYNWMWFVEGISLQDINRITLRKFIDFCNQPPTQLIAPTSYPYFVVNKETKEPEINPKWKPFVHRGDGEYIRKTTTLKAQLSLLSSFFLFLADLEYCDKNPAAVLLRRLNVNNTRVSLSEDGDKSLSTMQWQYVWQEVNRLADADPAKHERTRLLFALLYMLYPRVSEISARPGYTPLMSSFIKHRTGKWIFKIPRSKGGKSRSIPCSSALIQCLVRYRRFLGLPDLPVPNESTPLFVRHKAGTHGREAGILNAQLGIEAISGIVKDIFNVTADILQNVEPYEAEELRKFSIHSIRHTGISNAIANNEPLQTVMKNAGHSDLSTLSIYTSGEIR
ncbi:tyrosine-type recombinase/integrase [Flocculibacter collagenilyticus]|uniref:tyrosine-type recombinase/integrase n=1 Tax=Flocculibacter collagenilyticus TaxID=2744479 RepID=UPI0018F5573B|nr:site-specific integrase [Flocculibacter collagenilyticus]